MAKANAVTGSSLYIPAGGSVPDELHPDVRLVGPGAPAPVVAEPEEPGGEPEPAAATEAPGGGQAAVEAFSGPPGRPNVNAPKADWVTYAVAVDGTLGYETADELTKAELVKRYGG